MFNWKDCLMVPLVNFLLNFRLILIFGNSNIQHIIDDFVYVLHIMCVSVLYHC